jgi:class 3 adenylate cyclase
MWRLNINEPERDVYWVDIHPGATSIGRSSTNTIALVDSSASRHHAEILFDNARDVITIHDLNSTNGTYVNRRRISSVVELHNNDNIRIGNVIFYLTNESDTARNQVTGTHFFTREIILEALDEHAVVLDDVAQKLNTLMNVASLQRESAAQLKRILMLDEVKIVLAPEFQSLQDARALMSIKKRTVEVTATQMCIPIVEADQVQGVICLAREAGSQFSRRDMELAIAISHQTALTLNRLRLLEKSREQERARELLLRFVSPLEVDYLLKDYLKSGKLPELVEQKATILFADIADSTAIAERIGPKRFADFLTRYYQDVTEIIFRYGGVIKYIGDGIMASFVSTSTQTVIPQEIRAVQAGWQILNRLRRNEFSYDGEKFVVGIAVNTGPAMVGYIGVGARAEFNVLGDTVNTASRMQGYARPNRLVVGTLTMHVVADKFTVHPIGEIDVRGRSAPVQIYEIAGDRRAGTP